MGAWIETRIFQLLGLVEFVAPLVGAWIETYIIYYYILLPYYVAPLVGAWIET